MDIDWKAVSVFISLFIAWSTLLFGAIKWLLDRYQKHIDQRFESLEKARQSETEEWRRLERQFMDLRAELPREYVRRDDWLRSVAVLDARYETLTQKIERLLEKKNT